MHPQVKQRIAQIQKNEVPSGYKQTEVGIVPSEWKENNLKDIGNFSRGRGISGKDMCNTGLPCVGYGDIYTKYNISFNKTDNFIAHKVAANSVSVGRGALLFTSSGETSLEIGKCVCYIGKEKLYVGGDITILEPYNTMDSLFLAYQQNTFPAIKKKARYGQGHSVVHIYPNELGRMVISYPENITEQARIAEILSTQDKLIKQQEKLITQKKEQKKYLMQVLLTGKKRLKGFSGEWEKKTFEEAGIKITDGDRGKEYPNSMDFFNSSYCLFLSAQNITKNGFKFENTQFINLEKHKKLRNGLVQRGDIILTTRGSVGHFSLYDESIPFDVIRINSGMVILTVNSNKILALYLYCLSKSDIIKHQITVLAFGSAQPQLTVKIIKNIKLSLPSLLEQKEIASFLTSADKEIELLEVQLEQEQQKQKALMQLLLTGVVRV